MAGKQKGPKASSSKAGSIRQVGAFRLLQIGKHCCYMRAHDGEDDRTMFLVNLPTDSTDRHVKALFNRVGIVESVRLWKPHGVTDEEEEYSVTSKKGKAVEKESGPPAIVPLPPLDPRHPHRLLPTATSAHVTFLDESALKRALDLTHIKSWPDPFAGIAEAKSQLDQNDDEARNGKKKKIRTAQEAAAASNTIVPPIGLDFLKARHRALRPPLSSVKAHVDSVIANYEYKRAHPTKKASGIQVASVGPNGELLDEDGFIIVQSTGKYGRTGAGETGASVKMARRRGAAVEAEEEAERAKKKKRFELEDFYRFQRREQKREELANLRAKFQEDQEKVKKLKANRSFKPF